jgi:DNA-binding NtrC family response regulator
MTILARDPVMHISRRPPRVLVVDDEEYIRTLLMQCLEREGYVVCVSSNGHEALKLATQYDGQIDLLITDVNMPGMSGVELANLFTSNHPSVPILIISGRMDLTNLDQQQWNQRPMEVLPKPFRLDVLRRKVADAIRRRSMDT